MTQEVLRQLCHKAQFNAAGSAGKLLQQAKAIELAGQSLTESGVVKAFSLTAVPSDRIVAQLVTTRHTSRPVLGGVLYAVVTCWLIVEVTEHGMLLSWREHLTDIDDCGQGELTDILEQTRIEHCTRIVDTLGHQSGTIPEFVIFDSPLTGDILQAACDSRRQEPQA